MRRLAKKVKEAERFRRAVSAKEVERARGMMRVAPDGLTVESLAEHMSCCTAHARECLNRLGAVVVRKIDKGRPGQREQVWGLKQAREDAAGD